MGLLDLMFSQEHGAEVGSLICKAHSGRANYKVTYAKNSLPRPAATFYSRFYFDFLNCEFRRCRYIERLNDNNSFGLRSGAISISMHQLREAGSVLSTRVLLLLI